MIINNFAFCYSMPRLCTAVSAVDESQASPVNLTTQLNWHAVAIINVIWLFGRRRCCCCCELLIAIIIPSIRYCFSPLSVTATHRLYTCHSRAAAWQRVKVTLIGAFWHTFTPPVAYRYQKKYCSIEIKALYTVGLLYISTTIPRVAILDVQYTFDFPPGHILLFVYLQNSAQLTL